MHAQAFLETDPSNRETKDVYIMRYQRFARDQVVSALQMYEGLQEAIGKLRTHVEIPL